MASTISACNPLIEDYTEIFYMIDEGDITFIQCKMILRGAKSITKIMKLRITFKTGNFLVADRTENTVSKNLFTVE
jgi:hypothetical protein